MAKTISKNNSLPKNQVAFPQVYGATPPPSYPPSYGQTQAPQNINQLFGSPPSSGSNGLNFVPWGGNTPGVSAPGIQNNAPGSGLSKDQMPLPGSGSGTGGNAFSIDKILQAQLDEWNKSDAANTNRFNDAAGFLKGLPGQYASDPNTVATQGLVANLLKNPEGMDDRTMQMIRNRIQNQISSQGRNAFRQQTGILQAGGNADSSTLAAAAAAQARQDQAAKANANTQLEIQRAMQRNADIGNAIGIGQSQTKQDISVPLGVGQSIISNLPQQRPNDYAGLGMMGLQGQIMQMLGQRSPGSTATGTVGGGGPQQMGGFIDQKQGQKPPEGWIW